MVMVRYFIVNFLQLQPIFITFNIASYALINAKLIVSTPHTYVGGNLALTCIGHFEEMPKRPEIRCKWAMPSTVNDKKLRVNITDEMLEGASRTRSNLAISSLELTDSGLYSCSCGDFPVTTLINVSTKPRVDIRLLEDSRFLTRGERFHGICNYTGFPFSKMEIWQKHCRFNEVCQWNKLNTSEEKDAAFKRELHFTMKANMTGTLKCNATIQNFSVPVEQSMEYIVREFVKPEILNQFGDLERLPEKLTAIYLQPRSIPCQAHGFPNPSISWYKNGQKLNQTSLEFERVVKEDAGDYACVAESRFGKDEWNFRLEVEGGPAVQQNALVYSLSALACSGLIGLIIALALLHWQRAQREQLQAQLWATTNSGQQLELDPSIPIQQQTENLPYDKTFELPTGCIDLRTVIGQGQFGKVYHAFIYLEGIAEPVQVAVKVPRDGKNVEHQKALLSELRIMIYLGRHVNVLGLVGAITKNMSKGKLFVVTEYCKFASLLDFLRQRQNLFVNEVDRLNSSTELRANNGNDNDGYLAPKPMRSTYRSQQDPTWSDQLLSDQAASGFICTTDLLSFCYQTSNGMAFLASKNLIHRDLAARNVLLADGFVVKICDFGLARNHDTYQTKKSLHVPMPVKWMALESIKFQQHTEKSDVWSFGVLLWEVFTLGEVPYSQTNYDENFVHMLEKGHRLQQSEFCPDDVYELMRRCWAEDPDSRPNFVECKAKLETQLGLCSTQKMEQIKRPLLSGSSESGFNPRPQSFLENELNDGMRTPRSREACVDNDSILEPTAETSFSTAQNPAYFASIDVPLSDKLTDGAAVPLMQDLI